MDGSRMSTSAVMQGADRRRGLLLELMRGASRRVVKGIWPSDRTRGQKVSWSMSIKRMACVLAAVSVAAGACSDDEGSSPEVSGGNKQVPTAGSIALGLEVAPGVEIDSVDYEVTGTGIAPPITGSLALGDGVGTTFVANINGIPGGTGRLL